MTASTANNSPDIIEEKQRLSKSSTAFESQCRLKDSYGSNCYFVSPLYITTGNTAPIRTSASVYSNLIKSGINKEAFSVLESIGSLVDNWDNEGAIAPQGSVVNDTFELLLNLSLLNRKVYNLAPGPYGEIMIELRNGDRSIEFIFYSDRKKVVDFTNPRNPSQGNFDVAKLPSLLDALDA